MILTPPVLLIAGTLQFGPAVFQQFREFLGHSVNEIVHQAEELVANPDRPIPFPQIHQEFDHVAMRETISDTEAHQVREATVLLHHAMARRYDSDLSSAVREQQHDSYVAFLNHSLFEREKVFSRWTDLRQWFVSDLDSLRTARTLPRDSSLPLTQYIDAADTATRLVQQYASRFGDPGRCRAISGFTCEKLFLTSADVTGRFLQRYADRWPQFDLYHVDEPNQLRRHLDGFIGLSNRLRNDFPRFLGARPWDQLESVRSTYDRFQNRFHNQLRSWYASMLRELVLTPDDFQPHLSTLRAGQVEELLALETTIQNHDRARRVFLKDQAMDAYENFQNQLQTTLLWLEVRGEYGTEPESRDRELLRELVRTHPEGQRKLYELDENQQTLVELRRELDRAIEQQDYSLILDNLTFLQESALDHPVLNAAGRLLTRDFITDNESRFRQPDWLPETSEGQENYTEMIQNLGELAQAWELDRWDQTWVEQTLMAMRDRRFNQLRDRVTTHLENLNRSNRSDLVETFRELYDIDDLAEELITQADDLMLEAALVERFQLGTTTLHENFEPPFQRLDNAATAWNQGGQFATTFRGEPNKETLRTAPDTMESLAQWHETLRNNYTLTSALPNALAANVTTYLQSRGEWLRETIREADQFQVESFPAGEDFEAFRQALTRAENLPFLSEIQNVPDLGPWQNLQTVRSNLARMEETVPRLERGGLLGSDPNLETFRTAQEEAIVRPLPEDYSYELEQAGLNNLQQLILERARHFQQQSESQWFGGMRGLSGRELLAQWEDFLDELHTILPSPEARQAIEELRSSLEQQRQELSP